MRPLPRLPLLLLALLPLLGSLGGSLGCNRPSYETPVKAYQSFLRAAQRGDEKTAWAALSQPTQAALKARAQTVAEASSGAVKPEPASFFFANVPPPTDVTEVSLASDEGDVAKVNVISSSGKSQVRMAREASGWKVDLTQSLPQP